MSRNELVNKTAKKEDVYIFHNNSSLLNKYNHVLNFGQKSSVLQKRINGYKIYLPLKFAFLFSRNAAVPSFISYVPKQLPNSFISVSNPFYDSSKKAFAALYKPPQLSRQLKNCMLQILHFFYR